MMCADIQMRRGIRRRERAWPQAVTSKGGGRCAAEGQVSVIREVMVLRLNTLI